MLVNRTLPSKRVAIVATAALAVMLPTWTAASAKEASSPPGHGSTSRPWEAFNYSPSSRTVEPTSVYTTVGDVTAADAVLTGKRTRLSGAGAAVTLDFGKDVGGIVTLHFSGSAGAQQVGLAFSESSKYVGSRPTTPEGRAAGTAPSPTSTAGPPTRCPRRSCAADSAT